MNDWPNLFLELNALWRMSDPNSPHVKTSMSGEHVTAYFNSDKIIAQPELVDGIVKSVLVPYLDSHNLTPDWVFSYAPYGLPVAYSAARQLNAKCGYTLPTDSYSTTFQVPKSSKVLVVADDIYSGKGVEKTIATLESMGVDTLPVVFCLANMSNREKLLDKDVISAVKIDTERHSPDNCRLCKSGSEALIARPNWSLLTST